VDFDTRHWQFRLLATVYHGASFGHYMELETQIKGRDSTKRIGLGQWTGVGVPADVLYSAGGLLLATFDEHLTTRYGVREELPWPPRAERDPF
jgi:hypothetical protein